METDNQTNLPIELDSQWMHMNNIEHEKLQWMKDLPKPSVQQQTDDSVPINKHKSNFSIFSFRNPMEFQLVSISKVI